MARFSRTMAMLIKAGLPMLEVIQTAGDVINNRLYQKSFEKLPMRSKTEHPIKVIKEDKNFMPMVAHMVNLGEKSGNLDYVFDQIATFFEKDVDNMTRNLSTLIEPLLMIVMGVAVGLSCYLF